MRIHICIDEFLVVYGGGRQKSLPTTADALVFVGTLYDGLLFPPYLSAQTRVHIQIFLGNTRSSMYSQREQGCLVLFFTL